MELKKILTLAVAFAAGCSATPPPSPPPLETTTNTTPPGPPTPGATSASEGAIDPSCASDPTGIDGKACSDEGKTCGIPGYAVVCANGAWTRTPPCCKK